MVFIPTPAREQLLASFSSFSSSLHSCKSHQITKPHRHRKWETNRIKYDTNCLALKPGRGKNRQHDSRPIVSFKTIRHLTFFSSRNPLHHFLVRTQFPETISDSKGTGENLGRALFRKKENLHPQQEVALPNLQVARKHEVLQVLLLCLHDRFLSWVPPFFAEFASRAPGHGLESIPYGSTYHPRWARKLFRM